MFLQITGMLIRVLPVLVAAQFAPDLLSQVFALTGFAFYAIYLAVLLSVIGISGARIGEILLHSLPLVVLFVVAGVGLKLLLTMGLPL